METRDVLLKADKVVLVIERISDGKIRGDFAESGARGGDHREAGRAGPGRQADRLPGHRRHRSGRGRLRPESRCDCDALRRHVTL